MPIEVKEARESDFVNHNPKVLGELDERQRHQLLIEWNQTASAFPKGRCIHELFAEQAAQTPRAQAVAIGGEFLTYADLDSRANQLANYLRTLGAGPEVVVALCIERSFELIVGLLGILKAGGVYLPIDRNYPSEHIAWLLQDAGAPFVLTSAATDGVITSSGARTVRLDFQSPAIARQPKSAPVSGASAENLAYVMYTSGSTGRFKGVGVVHNNISRLVLNTNYVRITADDVFLQLAPATFDAATFEIWGALLNGAKLALYPPDPMLDPLKLKNVIHKAGVSILWLTAGLFNTIVDGDVLILAPVKQLLVGGDAVSARHVKNLLGQIRTCRAINGYGPTEGTTFSVCFPIPDSSAIEDHVPIGRPISNSTVYVLDADAQPLPVGATGELYIGGAGLARGYFHRPDLTAESFVPNPFGELGSRLYRTGDMVRYSNDGLLDFVGRVDFQVKVRGYRIELEEVEAAVLTDPSIRQAAVVAQPEPLGDKKLVAYVVGAGEVKPDIKKLREHLSRRLPEYMIPSALVVLDALPLTANGKVDRRALLPADKPASHATSLSELEDTIAEIWASALGKSSVRMDVDFFDLGGTSVAIMNVVLEMSKRFALPLDLNIFAHGTTVSAVAEAVREIMTANVHQGPPVEQVVAEIWASILGTTNVGLDDDFFELGGTSLALINVVLEMSKRFAIPLDPNIVAHGSTVSTLAQAVRERMTANGHQGPPVEQVVAEIWASTLGTTNVGLDDDFFELGGTSLALINVVLEMSKRFAIPLDPNIVARGSTVSALAQAVRERMTTNGHQRPPVEQVVAEIWASALGTTNVGLDDDFFELGGTSLALINVVLEMSKRFAIPLDPNIVARGSTVSALAQAVRENMANTSLINGSEFPESRSCRAQPYL